MISGILSALCKAIIEETLGGHVQRWTVGVKARDAQGLAFHTLAVLISYKRCFELKQCHWLIEVLLTGLDEQPATIKCCLHALSLAAFEMQTSVTKSMTRILEKLSQIMSNTDVAVHIMGFLFLIGALPPLYQNFRFEDFQLVFGVGLQYLQLYNSTDSLPPTSWALSQFVRLLSFSIVYAWFLAIRLPDRQKHIPYITRLLLTANEGKPHIDSMTEVCFDWLARYTYGSGDPRPANSLLSDIVMSPSASRPPAEMALFEKTWVRGDSIITIRTLARLGWVEIIVRRPSGFTKFLGRVENAPMVGSGDVRPDFISGPAAALMERGLPQVKSGPMPDPITGYVWSKTAPSQRRKDVSIDPSFFALQFCTFPDPRGLPCLQQVTGVSRLNSFLSTLDRMPVIDTHKVGILYVAPGQQEETEILRNTHGSPAYTRFLEGLGRLINLRGQVDVYAGGLDPDEDGEYAYAWWDDIGQILYHTATMMPTSAEQDPHCVKKKSHIGNDYIRIVWNDSGHQYRFDTLQTQFQFCNIVIEPHSLGAIAAFSDNLHENEYFKLTVQRADGMPEFLPVGAFKVVSAQSLPLLVRQLSLLADWFASVYAHTLRNSEQVEMKTNWVNRLESIQRFRAGLAPALEDSGEIQDFTTIFS
ncbi:hypothetical protein FISHEDRAFT_40905 [Fistulina hepatica ATCC 64428]|uniref:Rap-GAP domain-containing protein n=1 Tax=Fistulina hepatica ATCC 64428 TaxID=1128425 RepID=A0A0D7AEP4_9AGAR|nr:hypothetical protein FISHEDRAFT_40905 [Fistulina hepatica ATCC 64428]